MPNQNAVFRVKKQRHSTCLQDGHIKEYLAILKKEEVLETAIDARIKHIVKRYCVLHEMYHNDDDIHWDIINDWELTTDNMLTISIAKQCCSCCEPKIQENIDVPESALYSDEWESEIVHQWIPEIEEKEKTERAAKEQNAKDQRARNEILKD